MLASKVRLRFLITAVFLLVLVSVEYLSVWGSWATTQKVSISADLPVNLPSMELPGNISEVFLNIGSNLDPILPPVDSGDKGLTIAFEPIVGCKIKPHKQLMVVQAAVDATAGLSSMFVFNQDGLSSSLSKPAYQDFWNSDSNRDGHIQIVPIITLRQILHAIPLHIAIPYIKTDMQGHDFVAIAAAGESLFKRNVDYLYTEVYVNNLSSYKGVNNDFCTTWWPHMQRVGYDLVFLEQLGQPRLDPKATTDFCAQQRLKGETTATATEVLMSEGNALWKRKGAADRDFAFQTL
ncbi:hypothetical protein MHU86_9135 [Fragilaria crotonensis]|nr:hypothetical protein MHU86_9135 [Fragilaria crotonensis]